jgi:hypothetical protein
MLASDTKRSVFLSRRWFFLMLCLSVCSGCGIWNETLPSSLEFPNSRMSVDSVTVEIGFVPLPQTETGVGHEFWQEVDETHFAPQLRQRLHSNGIRCAVAGLQLPTAIRQHLTATQAKASADSEALDFEKDFHHFPWRRKHIRTGWRTEVVMSKPYEKLAVLASHEGLVEGVTKENAQCLFELKTFPLGDGRVRMELTPEIHHGPPRNDWKGDSGMWQFHVSRKRLRFDELRVEAVLSPGESVLLGCTPTVRGLGMLCFVDPDHSLDSLHTLLVIRLAQTQRDDRFVSMLSQEKF